MCIFFWKASEKVLINKNLQPLTTYSNMICCFVNYIINIQEKLSQWIAVLFNYTEKDKKIYIKWDEFIWNILMRMSFDYVLHRQV